MEVTQEMPRALLEQSCCIGLIGKNVVIDCETRAEAEEVLDWLCDGRTAQATALAAKEAELAAERAKVEKLREALALCAKNVDWMPYPNCVQVDDAIRASLAETQP